MTDRPVIVSGPMVMAALEGRKTQTRRLAWRDVPIGGDDHRTPYDPASRQLIGQRATIWQKVKPGDRLWVRENWRVDDYVTDDPERTIYHADMPGDALAETRDFIKWRPSIHMPRARSRMTWVVTATKIERLQEIGEADCIAEGALLSAERSMVSGGVMAIPDPKKPWLTATPRAWFRELWDLLHGAGAWDSNPEVVAVTFTVHMTNIDRMTA